MTQHAVELMQGHKNALKNRGLGLRAQPLLPGVTVPELHDHTVIFTGLLGRQQVQRQG